MSRFKVNRIGFINFWLYDEEDFYFYDGKLLLRGTNGSGKTVTMQSFFPLIFDGNKSPERLDPFGSRDRKIEDYLLPEGFNGNENTGYLYMEFFNKEENKYLTIGIGLRAIKNRNCEFWGFAITDGRRIGMDLLLFKERNLRIPLTKKELQTRIGTGGLFVESAKEYKKMVNKLLFGFPNIDLYTEFINLLIQVRSPKLSNSTRPSQLTKILSTVLEPLSDEDLRVMADSIEDMNKYKEKLQDLKQEQRACHSLKNSYLDFNKSILYKKGDTYLEYKQNENNIQKTIKEKQIQIKELETEIENENTLLKELRLESESLEHRKNKLDETDLKSITNQLDELMAILTKLEKDKKTKDEEFVSKETLLHKEEKELQNKENDLYTVQKSFTELILELTSFQEIIDFEDTKYYLDLLKKERLDFQEMYSYLDTIKKQVILLTDLKNISYKIYQKEEEISKEKNKYEQDNDLLKELEQKHIDVSNSLITNTQEFKEMIIQISNNNQILKLDNSPLNNIYQVIDNLELDMFSNIKDIIKEQVYVFKDKIKLDISTNNISMNEKNNYLNELQKDLDNIANILLKNSNDEDTIKYFQEEKIDYKYFFEVIKFRDNVEEKKRKQIESFLFDTGLMTAFIVNERIDNYNVKAKCLKEGKKVDQNLLMYVDALDTIFKDKVIKILKSISVNNQNNIISILDNGKYEFALLEGLIDPKYELKYIGEDVRKQYILKEQEKIKKQINNLSNEIEELNRLNKQLKDNLLIIDEEYNKFKYPHTINDLFKQIDKINRDIEFSRDNLSKLVELIKIKNDELRVLEKEIDQNKKNYKSSLKYHALEEILDNTINYLELAKELSNTIEEYKTKDEFVKYYQSNIITINEDLERINEERDKIEYDISNYENKRQTIEDLLNSDKYKDVGKEYKKIIERLNYIKEEIPKKSSLITRNEVNIEHLNNDLQTLNMQIDEISIFKEVAYKIYKDEYELNYVTDEELDENKINQFIKNIKPNNTNREIYEKFNDNVNKFGGLLLNYAPKNITLHLVNDNEYLNYTNDATKKEKIDNLLEEAKRRDIVFNYLGKNVNLLELSSAIENSILSYENLISEENRKLFEDLLINNIGSSIRNKIWQSEEWIGEVKDLMESMNTTSGLSFSLKWLGVDAQTEDELNTKEIVSIFRQDAEKLKPEHLEKITKHFKSKIKMKEDALEESERNYLEIIKEVLDYRKWFEFKLFFKRGDSEKKELTDREFNKMSGGEKAIAMYIPLFSSIYAKLNSAYPTSPRAIALDEAFAGVDDDNIKDAFRILSKLDIDYVLTSQQLWGDYETVKHLAISELHHPIGSNVVSVIKYKWDGISRSKIEDVKEYQT